MSTETPMLDKMAGVKERSQVIGEFLDWLGTQGMHLCTLQDVPMAFWDEYQGAMDVEEVTYWPVNKNIERLLAEYFGIDLDQAEQERRELLERIRAVDKYTDSLARAAKLAEGKSTNGVR